MLADLLHHAREILNAAAERGIGLRLAGSIAIVARCPVRYEERERQKWIPGDIDFACDQKESLALGNLFRDLHYENDQRLLIATEGRRWTLYARDRPQSIDVFFDQMEFCHRLDLRGRISIDPETLTLADLLLSKLQYVAPRQDDLDDLIAIMGTYPARLGDGDIINLERIITVLAASWGFYHTASLNFERIRAKLEQTACSGSAFAKVAIERLITISRRVDEWPKGRLWKMRALIGPKLKWYDDVEGTEAF